MSLVKLERNSWHDFWDAMTDQVLGKQAEIEIASRTFGVQVVARWQPLIGLVYDWKRETLEISVDGVDHLVMKPQELYVEYGASGLESIGILDSEGAWQIVLLRYPMMLPAPNGRA